MSVPTLRDLDWSSMAKRRSLPVQFALYPSRRMNGALCPCLIVCENGIEIVRILDPEHKQPFFSLEGMFLLAGLSITTGILRFDLRRERGDYDLTLAGLEPRDGIWAPLSVAQRIATELDLNFSLRTLFSFKHAWSLDQGGKSGLIHNWQVSNQHINPSSYSLTSLCRYPFDTFTVLSRGQQINTLIDQEEREEMQKKEVKIFHSLSSSSAAEQRLLRWTVQAIEQLLDIQQNNIDYDDDEINSIWTPTSIDLLMLFSDLSYGQENESFTTNDGKITVTKTQLREMRAQKTNDSVMREEDADLADAHTTLVLVDCLWKLYMDKTAMPLISQTLEGEQEEQQDGKETTSKQDSTQPDRFTQMHSSIEDIKKVLYTMQKRRPGQSSPPLQRSEGSPQTIRYRLFQITQSQFVIPLFLGIIIGMLLFQLAQS